MKKVQLALNSAANQLSTTSGTGAAGAGGLARSEGASRRQLRQNTEELRMKVLDLAERHMDVTLQVLKRWLSSQL